MPRKKDTTPRGQVNFLIPRAILDGLEQFRQPGEIDASFYRRIFSEWLDTRRTGQDPAVEAQVEDILRRHHLLPPTKK